MRHLYRFPLWLIFNYVTWLFGLLAIALVNGILLFMITSGNVRSPVPWYVPFVGLDVLSALWWSQCWCRRHRSGLWKRW